MLRKALFGHGIEKDTVGSSLAGQVIEASEEPADGLEPFVPRN